MTMLRTCPNMTLKVEWDVKPNIETVSYGVDLGGHVPDWASGSAETFLGFAFKVCQCSKVGLTLPSFKSNWLLTK